MESELVSILSADTNSDSDTDSIDTGIDASDILDYFVRILVFTSQGTLPRGHMTCTHCI